MKKKLSSILFGAAALAALGLTACGSSQDSASGSSAAQSQATAGGSESQAQSADGVTEITFWHSMDSVYGEITQKQVDAFNNGIGKEKGIHVTPVFQNWPGTDALTAAMSTDDTANMPDVIQLYSESVALVRDYKRTVWAEDMLGADGTTLKKEDLMPGAAAEYSIGGKMIGMPWTASALLLYYNQDYFDKAGVSVPKTIADMADIMPQLVEKTDAEDALNVRVNQYELENWIETQGPDGSEFGDNANGHDGYITKFAAADNGTLDKFLTEWDKVIKTGAYKATKDSMNEEFAAGMHAMVIMSSSKIPTIKDLVGDSFKWGVAAIPTVSADDIGGAYPSGSGLFMLDRDDEAKKAAAWEFVQYMASPEAQVMWLQGTGYTPINVKTLDLDAYKTAIADEPKLQVPYDVLMQSGEKVIPAFVPNNGTIDTVIKDSMLAFADGSADKDATFTAIKDGVDKALEDYYRANPIEQ